MFFYTAKFSKKKAIAIVAGIAVLLCLAIVIAVSVGGSNASGGNTLKTNEDRIAYLRTLGWEVEAAPLDVQNIVIPREFGDVYTEYIELQRQQGYTLEKYGGMNAVRYTYRITNYPDGSTDIVADMVLYNDSIIAGDIQCTASDGFMAALKPTEEQNAEP